ncbi:MAG: zinc ribbon domain-containing protein [Candidatus Jordarchaeaceae archaeon]
MIMVGRDPAEIEKQIKSRYVLTSKDYENGLRQGKLLGLKCKDCGAVTCPPMMVCQRCGSINVMPTELSGRCEIMTYTVIRVPPEGFQAPYIVCLAKTVEGPWIVGRLDYDPQKMSEEMLGKTVKIKGVFAFSDKYTGGEHVCPVFGLA